MNEASDLNKTDQVGMSFPLFRWTYHFDMEEASYNGDAVPEDTDVIRLPDDAQETVLCPDVHPRFDHDWNFRFLKGELTEITDLQKFFNYLIEKYFEKRFKAKTLLDVWSRSDLSTADRRLSFSRFFG